eukprot:TRINITY_DN1472_c0_g1_i1.p1 TRINITY_DN1472_c0_g1~~TRINITY_DN1472_c0_g1_i1.p1  ORF type:complete len:384 (+),score=36.56 TRINITY_DN1472_c0_g1_i1:39-1154(+)
MYVPTETEGLILAFVSMVCWGSWSNLLKVADGVRFEIFYIDFCIGMLLCSILAAASFGEIDLGEGDGSAADLNHTIKVMSEELPGDGEKILWATISGAVFNLSNILLVNGITISGMVVAFPLGVGTALVLGTILTYITDTEGNPFMLFSGVALGFLAVCAVSLTYRSKEKDHMIERLQNGEKYASMESDDTEDTVLTKSPSPVGVAKPVSNRKAIAVCLISGVLMGCWAPLIVQAQEGSNGLSPYGALVWFQVGVLFSMFIFLTPLMRRPLTNDPPVWWSAYTGTGSCTTHTLGLLSGIIWHVGTTCNILGGSVLGFAISYAIGQSAPMVASLWGLLVWKEFTKTSFCTRVGLVSVFALYAGAITLIALSK